MVNKLAQRGSEKPHLGYWESRGTAQHIRYLLIYLGVDFEETRYPMGDAPEYDRSAWTSKKDNLGLFFPSLPYFIDGECRLTDSKAIMKFIACKYGTPLLGKGAAKICHVEMIT